MFDFSQVQADDAAIDALAEGIVPERADELSRLLLAWRASVDAVPIGELVSPRLAARRRGA